MDNLTTKSLRVGRYIEPEPFRSPQRIVDARKRNSDYWERKNQEEGCLCQSGLPVLERRLVKGKWVGFCKICREEKR